MFQQESRGMNFILEVCPQDVVLQDLLKNVLGKVVFVSWPHLVEAKVRKSVKLIKFFISQLS